MIQRTIRIAGAMFLLAALCVPLSVAQTGGTFTACYVPEVGALYLIGLEGLPDDCLSENHVEVSWTEGGGGGVTDHGALQGLENDDHPQYLLAEGTRAATDGFAVTGTLNSGVIPAEGAGVRLMWYPAKAALRAGEATGDRWDDANIGLHSVAMGTGRASGELSVAMGNSTAAGDGAVAFGASNFAGGFAAVALGVGTQATGITSMAMGDDSDATGDYSFAAGKESAAEGLASFAVGDGAVAGGFASVAMGATTLASGDLSTALGNFASTNGFTGSFVYGDNSVGDHVTVEAENSFVVRAQRVWFGQSGDQTATANRYIETSTGAFLSAGGTWTNASSAALKENFRDEDAEAVLAKLAELPVRSWNYKAEDPGVRHLGPTAEDFHAAFGLGDGDGAIGTVDAAGVALLAIQALERRTRELMDLRDRFARLEQANAALLDRVARLELAEKDTGARYGGPALEAGRTPVTVRSRSGRSP